MGDISQLWVIAAFALGYILGAIPFGLLLTRAAGLGDVRNIGSGNIGATNVLRTGNKGLAALTLVLDALKGTVAVLLGYKIGTFAGDPLSASLVAGLGAFVGHLFPVWLRFEGGKGVATYIGVLLGLSWPAALGFCAVWLLVAVVSRYSSLSALVAAVVTPIGLVAAGEAHTAFLCMFLSALLFYKHRANIRRLTTGEEPKIGANT